MADMSPSNELAFCGIDLLHSYNKSELQANNSNSQGKKLISLVLCFSSIFLSNQAEQNYTSLPRKFWNFYMFGFQRPMHQNIEFTKIQ